MKKKFHKEVKLGRKFQRNNKLFLWEIERRRISLKKDKEEVSQRSEIHSARQ